MRTSGRSSGSAKLAVALHTDIGDLSAVNPETIAVHMMAPRRLGAMEKPDVAIESCSRTCRLGASHKVGARS